MIDASTALERLKSGNARFVAGSHGQNDKAGEMRRLKLVDGQQPFAIILGCADSRVPAEFVFDQGLGDLFVIRVAGNIIAASLIGSAEFAATMFSTRLIVVLGHSGCGAVAATIDHLKAPGNLDSPHLAAIVDSIRPSVQPLIDKQEDGDDDALLDAAIRANALATVNQLRRGSDILKSLEENDGLVIVAAEYDLATGAVGFLD